MAEKLPRFIVLKAQRNDKYLIHLRDQNYLQPSGTNFMSLHAKFEVVASSKEDGLVHFKCCYNQKYWVCRPDQERITADAHEMEEDQTKTSCTLFEPVFYESTRIRLFHVNIKRSDIIREQTTDYLKVGSDLNDHNSFLFNLLDFFNWESLTILPRYIALKGDCGNYLSVYEDPYDPFYYLKFNCKDKGDQKVGNEVFTTPDGKIRLKSNYTGRFWSLNRKWISPDSEDNTNLDTLFEVIKVNHNKIALKNLGNNMFCQGQATDCLNATSSTIPELAKFLVEDLVSKRNIFNVRFDEKAISIYEKEILNEVKSTHINNTEVAQQETMEFEYTNEESQTWTTSDSLKQTVEIEITVGVPDVVQGKLKYAHEVTTTVEAGKTLNEKSVKKFTKTVTVPPNCKVVTSFRVTQALCDIPYTYSLIEAFTNGTSSDPHNRDDGLYTSVRTEVHFESSQTKGLGK